MEFRIQALRELNDPSGLDAPTAFRSRPTIAVLVAVTALVAGSAAWAFNAWIPYELKARGVLIRSGGIVRVETPYTGRIGNLRIRRGEKVTSGQALFDLTAQSVDATHEVVSAPANGRIVRVAVQSGALVGANTTVMELEDDSEALQALVALPSRDAPLLRPGTPVLTTVVGLPSSRFGLLAGTVISVSDRPLTADDLRQFVDGGVPLEATLRRESHVGVLVTLPISLTNASGLAWVGGNGPPQPLATQTEIVAAIRVGRSRPVDLLIGRR